MPLLAYFDPGAGSIVLQALVGGSAGLWVALRYWWSMSKAKHRFCDAAAPRDSHAQANRSSATRSD